MTVTSGATLGAASLSGGVDVHAHLFPRPFLDDLRDVASEFGSTPVLDRVASGAGMPAAELSEPGGERIRLMDDAKVRVQVLSYSAPHIYHPVPEARVRIARSWNDAVSEATVASRGRLVFFATLPLPLVEACVAEIDRARALPGAVGFALPTNVEGRGLDDPIFAGVFDRLNETGEVVFLHPDSFCAPGVLAEHGMEWSIGAPFEDTIAALRLVLSGTLARCPALRVVVPHLGGTVPFLLPRIDLHARGMTARPAGSPGAAHDPAPSTGLRRLLYDTAQSTPAMLALAAEVLGADRLVFGSDFPYANRADLRSPAEELLGLGEETAAAIFQGRSLGLELGSPLT